MLFPNPAGWSIRPPYRPYAFASRSPATSPYVTRRLTQIWNFSCRLPLYGIFFLNIFKKNLDISSCIRHPVNQIHVKLRMRSWSVRRWVPLLLQLWHMRRTVVIMVTKVKIFLSEQAKGKSKAGVALKTKSLSQGGGRNKVGKASPAKNLQVGSSRNRKKKVVKSAARPIQKVAAVKIVQPKKGDMQLSALSRAPEVLIYFEIIIHFAQTHRACI